MNPALALLALFTPFAHTASPLNKNLYCTAVHRTLDERNETVERSTKLSLTDIRGGQLRYETELAGRFFLITENKANADLFARITRAPDHTAGIVVRGGLDRQGRFTVTEVEGVQVYRLECQSR